MDLFETAHDGGGESGGHRKSYTLPREGPKNI